MTTTVSPPRVPAQGPGRDADALAPSRKTLGIRVPAVVIGAIAALVSFAGSWIPSFWGDEAASIMSAERPLASLFTMVQRVDAVHGLYYLFLHGWIQLFGASELSVRLPSAIGVGLAAAGTVVLAGIIFDRRVAILAGIVFAILPRVTYMGAEARSYALGTAIAVWLTVLLVVLLRRRTVSLLPWLAYALGFTLAIYSFLYLILLGVVHAAVLLSMTRTRALLRRWAAAAGLGVVLALPVIAWGAGEHGQIAFLGKRPKFSPHLIFVSQWFSSNWLAALCWALIVVGIIAATLGWRRRASSAGTPTGMILAISWLVIPTLLLELGNNFVAPMYTTRYVSFCTPAVAMLVAVGVTVLARNWMRVAAIVLLVGLAAPTYLAQRGPFAKNGGSDWRPVSAIVGQHAQPGDAIVFDSHTKPSQRPRLAMRLYPDDYQGLNDAELVTPYAQTNGLWDVVMPLRQAAGELSSSNTVWAVEMTPKSDNPPADVSELQRQGFRLVQQYPVHRTTVYELTRETS